MALIFSVLLFLLGKCQDPTTDPYANIISSDYYDPSSSFYDPSGSSEFSSLADFSIAANRGNPKDSPKFPTDGYIIVFENGQTAENINNIKKLVLADGSSIDGEFTRAVRGLSVSKLSKRSIDSLLNSGAVKYLEAIQNFTVDITQNNPPWGLDRLDQGYRPLNGRYEYDFNGTGIYVYIIDTGISTSGLPNEWLDASGISRVRAGYFASGFTTSVDCNGHGTHVAGTIGSRTYGVAKNVFLVPVRVLDCAGSGSTASVVAGIDWAVGDTAVPNNRKILSMSLGGAYSQVTNDAIARGIAAGITAVVAAGNNNADARNYSPASTPGAICVGSIDRTDTRSTFSNWGPTVTLFAPGNSITSTWLNGTNTISGTSMATPHVTGVSALLIQEMFTRGLSPSPSAVRNELLARASWGVTNAGSGSPQTILQKCTPISGCLRVLCTDGVSSCLEYDCSVKCGAGSYINSNCPSQPACVACQTCPPGYSQSTSCDGTTTYDVVTCTLIPTPACVCNPGEYISSCVNGVATCTACSYCEQGTFIYQACSGTATYEDKTCMYCPTCPTNSYISTACSGGYTMDLQCTDCGVCSQGQYISTPCDGSFSNNKVCANCPTCSGNTYRATACSGGPTIDQQCISCGLCNVGQYTSRTCSGGSNNDKVCTTCPLCATGSYAATPCSGGLNIDQQCTICPACTGNTYLTKACSGGTTIDRQCQDCGSCSNGQYISRACSGGSSNDKVCTTCPLCATGTYAVKPCSGGLSIDQQCQDCGLCSTGQYISRACSGGTNNDKVCTSCPACTGNTYLARACSGASTIDQQCLDCGTCPAGTFISRNCSGSSNNDKVCTDCGPCARGQYISRPCDGSFTNNKVCTACPACPAGTYLATPCSGNGTIDQVCLSSASLCTPCSVGQFISRNCSSPNTNDKVCTNCGGCPSGTYITSPCTGTSLTNDQKCSACPGCPVGAFISQPCTGGATVDRLCSACSPCAAGQYLSRNCTGTSLVDNDVCSACSCPVGTYIVQLCSSRVWNDSICKSCSLTCPSGYTLSACSGTRIRDDSSCSRTGLSFSNGGTLYSSVSNALVLGGTSATFQCGARKACSINTFTFTSTIPTSPTGSQNVNFTILVQASSSSATVSSYRVRLPNLSTVVCAISLTTSFRYIGCQFPVVLTTSLTSFTVTLEPVLTTTSSSITFYLDYISANIVFQNA